MFHGKTLRSLRVGCITPWSRTFDICNHGFVSGIYAAVRSAAALAVIRFRLEQTEPDLRGQELEARIESDYQELLPDDPTVRRYFDETGPVCVCPPRRGIQQLVEANAIRQLPEMQELEQMLRMGSQGRPTDRRLVVAATSSAASASASPILPSAGTEWRGLDEMLVRIHEYWEEFAGEPWEPEYLVGDSHFDNEPVHRMLEERFAIHPVFGRGTPLGQEHDWYESEGTPHCSQHGDMKLVQSQYFADHAKRRELGVRPGEAADVSQASSRWACVDSDCPVRATTSLNRNPRAYTYLPRRGVHKKRIALRTALMLRRNVAESFNAQLKGRGIGNRGMNVPRWVSSDREMKWRCYSTVLSMTLMRLVHGPTATPMRTQKHRPADCSALASPAPPRTTTSSPPRRAPSPAAS